LILRKRVILLFAFCAIALVCLLGRLAYVQLVWAEELGRMALETRMREVPVEPKRGVIYDRKGRELAISVNVESVYAIPAQVEDPEVTAAAVAEVLGMPAVDVLKKITLSQSFVWVQRKIPEDLARTLREMNLPGIDFTQESKRFYPKDVLACHILGIAGIDSQGLEGLEVYYDKHLRGTPGKIVLEFDARGKEMPQAVHGYFPPVDGDNLFLTIDEVVQFVAERELEKAVEENGAKGGTVIVMDPSTGDILALANSPRYDPNFYQDYPAEHRRNPAISDAYSPGSTLKPITAAGALEEGTITASSGFHCGGSLKVPGASVSCANGVAHGALDFYGILVKSCNVALATVGLRMGAETFHRYVVDFGLTQRTGVDFPGEAVGIMLQPSEIKPVDLAVMSFGQTLTITPIQLAAAISAIANDGVYMQPRLAREIRAPDGSVRMRMEPRALRQVISRDTAKELKTALQLAVEQGTGRRAYVEGYNVAGKTGTAQKAVEGRIVEGRYVASFVGFAPVDKPQVVALVMLDEPSGSYYGGTVAAPVFAAVMKDVLHYLEVPPDRPPRSARPEEQEAPEDLTVPDLMNLTPAEATEVCSAAGLSLRVEGSGVVVTSQIPAPGAVIPPGTVVLAYTDEKEITRSGLVRVPLLEGKSLRQAAERLAAAGLVMEPIGTGLAKEQYPRAGTQVSPGHTITVVFEAPGEPAEP
jgi:stage V sporulation protein D (sporulation-specific penicillin-binding protein)